MLEYVDSCPSMDESAAGDDWKYLSERSTQLFKESSSNHVLR